MKKSKKAGLILTVGAALFLAAGAPALADETDTISKNVYIGGVNVSGMTEEQATKAVEEHNSSPKHSAMGHGRIEAEGSRIGHHCHGGEFRYGVDQPRGGS